MRSRGARAAAAQRAAPGAGELRAAKHAGLVVAAAGHKRPVLRGGGRWEERRHVELRKHLAALPAEEALRGSARPSRPARGCAALARGPARPAVRRRTGRGWPHARPHAPDLGERSRRESTQGAAQRRNKCRAAGKEAASGRARLRVRRAALVQAEIGRRVLLPEQDANVPAARRLHLSATTTRCSRDQCCQREQARQGRARDRRLRRRPRLVG